jgi:hypothetical protein
MKTLAIALSALALPAFAQTTTTVTQQPPPTTTVTTQQQQPPPPPAPQTQVVVNPNDPNAQPPPPPPARVRVETEATPQVETVANGRSSAVIIATDALYGGFTGALIGGAVTLIDQGNNWQRDLMVGAGVGVLAGAGFGIYEAATTPRTVVRAVADRNNAASDGGLTLLAGGGRF